MADQLHEVPDLLAGWLEGRLEPPPVTRLLGIRLVSCEGGCSRMEMRVDQRHHNPVGIVHGGIFGDLADAAMGTAVASTLAEGESFVTVEMALHFFAPVREATLVAQAKVLRRGRTTVYVESDIAAEGKVVAKAASTCLVRRAPGAS